MALGVDKMLLNRNLAVRRSAVDMSTSSSYVIKLPPTDIRARLGSNLVDLYSQIVLANISILLHGTLLWGIKNHLAVLRIPLPKSWHKHPNSFEQECSYILLIAGLLKRFQYLSNLSVV